ncbi:MAG: Holliday junction resolvase RuvX [Campylobacteraceae bacterium]
MKLASIDIGLKRIGVALCLDENIVTPQNAILRKNRNQAASEVDNFLNEWQIDTLVVGLPNEGESADEMQRRIKHFVSLLNFKNKVVFMAEDFSSYEAKERMRGITKQKKDGKIDSLSAVIILERYLMSKK